MGLYIHVPFCRTICSYCHFPRSSDHDAGGRAAFVRGVGKEFRLRYPDFLSGREDGAPFSTCYLGGGTPSELEPELMRSLLECTVGRVDRGADFELTAEANPESFTPAVADAWKSAGINRVSMGVQSLEPGVLRLLGRACGAGAARDALALACRSFPRVSADWILGPGLEIGRLLAELDEAAALGVEHFSVYILELHEGTPLAADCANGRLKLPPDRKVESQYLEVVAHLAAGGFAQYEVSNFSRPGAESRHNQSYWSHRPWLGLGPGAHGFDGLRRYANQRDLASWLMDLEAGRLPQMEVDPLDEAAMRLEAMILGLRTTRGVPVEILPGGALDLEKGIDEGLWRVDSGRLVLTARGFLRIDTIEEKLARC